MHVSSSQSLVSYLEIWKLNLRASRFDMSLYLTYDQWRMAWYSFLRLLDVDFTSGFSCSECGQYPSIILCDATSLGYRRKYSRSLQDSPNEVNRDMLEGR